MLDRTDCTKLSQALRALTAPSGAVDADALAALGHFTTHDMALRIDLAASAHIGAPVVMVSQPSADLSALTRRQREVAALVAHGHSNKEIARLLALSPATVKDHVEAILRRLSLTRRGQIAARVLQKT